MYLAGLIADEKQISKEELQRWVEQAYWYNISEYTVAWIAAESPYGLDLALEWIDSDKENIASSGWSTLANWISITSDDELDHELFLKLLNRVKQEIDAAPNRVRYTMNGFVIAVGCYMEALTVKALELGKKIGKVQVEMGGTACKVPYSPDYIKKVVDKGRVGKKRKMARC